MNQHPMVLHHTMLNLRDSSCQRQQKMICTRIPVRDRRFIEGSAFTRIALINLNRHINASTYFRVAEAGCHSQFSRLWAVGTCALLSCSRGTSYHPFPNSSSFMEKNYTSFLWRSREACKSHLCDYAMLDMPDPEILLTLQLLSMSPLSA